MRNGFLEFHYFKWKTVNSGRILSMTPDHVDLFKVGMIDYRGNVWIEEEFKNIETDKETFGGKNILELTGECFSENAILVDTSLRQLGVNIWTNITERMKYRYCIPKLIEWFPAYDSYTKEDFIFLYNNTSKLNYLDLTSDI